MESYKHQVTSAVEIETMTLAPPVGGIKKDTSNLFSFSVHLQAVPPPLAPNSLFCFWTFPLHLTLSPSFSVQQWGPVVVEAGCSAVAGSGGLLVECTETSWPRGGSLQSNSKRHYPRQRAGTEQSLDLTGQTLSVEDVSYIPAVLLPVVIVHVKCCTNLFVKHSIFSKTLCFYLKLFIQWFSSCHDIQFYHLYQQPHPHHLQASESSLQQTW